LKQAYTFVLVRKARSKGGDKYLADVGEDRPATFYLPQSISRPDGNNPVETIEITFETKDE
jgi:hypothetical protein